MIFDKIFVIKYYFIEYLLKYCISCRYSDVKVIADMTKDSFLKALMESDSPENFEWLVDQL